MTNLRVKHCLLAFFVAGKIDATAYPWVLFA